jgi:hypothetical protein
MKAFYAERRLTLQLMARRLKGRWFGCRMRLKFDSALDPRVVFAQYGWWRGAGPLDCRDSILLLPTEPTTMGSYRTSDSIPLAVRPSAIHLCDIRKYVDHSELVEIGI